MRRGLCACGRTCDPPSSSSHRLTQCQATPDALRCSDTHMRGGRETKVGGVSNDQVARLDGGAPSVTPSRVPPAVIDRRCSGARVAGADAEGGCCNARAPSSSVQLRSARSSRSTAGGGVGACRIPTPPSLRGALFHSDSLGSVSLAAGSEAVHARRCYRAPVPSSWPRRSSALGRRTSDSSLG